ncbi:MAG: sugar phosphate nucleotidyltransferase [Bacteroidota bacterium]
MRAVIPVAGVGSRLRPHTYSIPKVLLNVAGKPIIGHILDRLVENGITEATIIVGHLGDKIKEYIGSNYSIRADYIEQEERQGLGQAIYSARGTFGSDPILIILGDTIFEFDLSAMMKSHYSAIGLKEVEDPRRFGVAALQDGFVKQLLEKPDRPPTNLAVVGLYYIRNPRLLSECLEQMITRGIRTKGEFQLTDGLQLMIEKGEKIKPFTIDGWHDCGNPETLLETNRHLLEKKSTMRNIEGVVVLPPVYISPTCQITRSVIGPYATIAGEAVVEDSIIRNSIVSEEARVYKALLENSIIGNNATVKGTYKRINIGDSSEIDFY